MSILKELKTRIKYKNEMEIWDYEMRMNILDVLERRFLGEGMWMSEFKEIHDAVFPRKMSELIVSLYDRRVNLKKLCK